ncbi:MAG: hypothetical protein LBN27_05870 [Prevotellaceae bacterium]|jgi:hypothetical protein|nr:hypothetical protein [Prevotellaceae bacterium]
MDWTTIISLIINLLLGGTLIVTLATLKSTKDKAEFEAKNTEVDYVKNMMDTQVNFIVEPLKKEIEEMRKRDENHIKEHSKLLRSVNRLEKAIERVADCPHSENCPVRTEINKNETK